MNANVQKEIPLRSTVLTVDPVDKNSFIIALRSAANGVSVVTTNGESGRYGGTVSSFCSVSADPPSMLVCLNKASRIMQAVADNGYFTINILSESDRFIAERFSGQHDKTIEDRFDGIEYTDSDKGPILPNSVALSCSLEQMIESGSHGVFIGLVEQVVPNNLKPLTYSNGAYHSIVPQLNHDDL